MREESTRLMALLNGERVSKPPIWEVWFGMREFCSQRYGNYRNVESRIAMALDLGMAAVSLGSINLNVHFIDNQETSAGTTRHAGGELMDIRQMEERELPDWREDILRFKEEQALIREAGLVSWVTLPWCFHAIATSMGLENFALRLYDDYEFVDHAFEWVEERSRKAIDTVIAEVRPDFVLFDGDCAYKNGLMVSPHLFRQLVLERTRETVSHLKPLGIPYTLHTDGKLDEVAPILIELGFSAVHGCEKAANDLGHLVAEFGDSIVLVGNMDVVLLTHATPSEIRQETTEMLRTGSSKGKFIAACNTSPLDYIPADNYLAFLETIRSHKE